MIYIEILDRRGGVLLRERVDALPIRIGRALSNDIIVDDPHVSLVHAEVLRDEAGDIVIRDLDSENGLFAGESQSAPRTNSLRVAPGETLRVGRTLLRLRTEDENLPPTLIEPEVGPVVTWLTVHWSASIVFAIAVCLTAAWSTYVATWTKFTAIVLLAPTLQILLQVFIWAGVWALPANTVKGAFAASGIYDLEPVRLSARNAYLNLDIDAARRNSPLHCIRENMPPMVVARGGGELAEFRRQAADYVAALQRGGHVCHDLDFSGLNHFEVGEEFTKPGGALLQAVFGIMGL